MTADPVAIARDLLRCRSVTPDEGGALAYLQGGIACFVAAATDYLTANGGKPKRGSISLLITGDEESVAVNGTIKLLQWGAERGEKFGHCLLGEPSNVEKLGDTIKAGRRGSLNGTLIVQ